MDREDFLRLATRPETDLNVLRTIQKEIAKRVILKDDFKTPIEYIGGVDSAYFEKAIITCCVIVKWPNLELIEQKFIISEITFPYISTYFAFREGPSIIEVLTFVKNIPTILMINSHGILHPFFAGCASHIGVLLDLSTIGVAQEVLCGELGTTPTRESDWTPITFEGRTLGACLLTQKKIKPVYISPGHRITTKTAVEIVKKCITNQKLPKPIHLAHKFANKLKNYLKTSHDVL